VLKTLTFKNGYCFSKRCTKAVTVRRSLLVQSVKLPSRFAAWIIFASAARPRHGKRLIIASKSAVTLLNVVAVLGCFISRLLGGYRPHGAAIAICSSPVATRSFSCQLRSKRREISAQEFYRQTAESTSKNTPIRSSTAVALWSGKIPDKIVQCPSASP